MKKRKPPSKPTKLTDIEQLGALAAKQRLTLTKTGRSLHDSAGPLLSAAGIHLQLLKMDVPSAGPRIQEVLEILDQAMDNVRAVSQILASSPIYRGGFQSALLRLIEEIAESAPVDINLDYSFAAAIPPDTAVALYDAVAAALKAAVRVGRASEIDIQVRDKPSLNVKITDNGTKVGRPQALAVPQILAREAGIGFEITPGKSTIVSIRVYAARRIAGR